MVRARPIVIVAGPTGSGKSDLALRIAQNLSGEVISCDSVQVYRGFDIGSAKPSITERHAIPHHVIDCCEGSEQYHAARFREDALRLIDEIQGRGRLPIIAGGTTLYLSALLSGLSDFPDSDPKIRERLQALSPEELYQKLNACDPERAAALHPNDLFRITRALEIFEQTGKSMSARVEENETQPFPYPVTVINLMVPPLLLRERILKRTERMLKSGLIAEVKSLLAKYPENAPAFSTVGYFEVVEFLGGRLAESELVEQISAATSRLAKRQRTFWRNEPAKRGWEVLPKEDQINEESVVRFADSESGSRGKGVQKGFVAFDWNIGQLDEALRGSISGHVSGVKVWNVCLRGDLVTLDSVVVWKD